MTSETIRFPVRGMICSSCVNRISRALRRVEGVQAVKVDLGRETVTLRRDPELASDAAVAAAIGAEGYDANLAAAVAIEPPPQPSQPARLFSWRTHAS